MSKAKPLVGMGRPLPVLTDPGTLNLETWVRLIRICQKVTRKVERVLEPHGLTSAQFDVLVTLAQADGIPQQELSDRLLVTKGNVCGLIDRASASGWVERRPDAEDRRVNRLFLTDRGREQLALVMPEKRRVINSVLESLRPEEIEQMYAFLGVLDHSLDRVERA